MSPALQAIEAEVRASGDWPDLREYGRRMVAAGASGAEAISMVKRYRMALFNGWRAANEAEPVSYNAEDELMSQLRAFSLGRG